MKKKSQTCTNPNRINPNQTEICFDIYWVDTIKIPYDMHELDMATFLHENTIHFVYD